MGIGWRAVLSATLLAHAQCAPLRGVKIVDFPNIQGVSHLPHFCYFVAKGAPYYSRVRHAVRSVASRTTNRELAFVEITTQFADTFKFFHLHVERKEMLPMAIMVNWTSGMGKKPYNQYLFADVGNESAMLDSNLMEQFVDNFFRESLEPWVRSEPVVQVLSEYSPASGAMTIVGSQFQEVALEANHDVLVMFYAPWCGFSKRMQPRIDELARRFGHVSTLRVVKIDGSENDVTHPVMGKMTGYPFLALFPAGAEAKGIPLEIHADADNSAAWLPEATTLLRQHASHPVPDALPADAVAPQGETFLDRDIEEF